MKLYHLSDLHFGVSPPSLGEDAHQKIVLRKLQEVIERAEREGVRFVVLAGDTFDSNALPSALVKKLLGLLARYQRVNFILLPGGGKKDQQGIRGHDAYTKDSLYRRLEVSSYFEQPHLFLLTPENPVVLFKEEGVAFYGGFFDFPRAEPQTEARFHVAVMHGAFGEREDFGEIPLTQERSLFYDYLALGHYHRHRRLTEKAAYSGAFVQFEFLPYQEGTSGYLEVDLSSSPPKLRYHVFEDAPRFLYHRVLNAGDLEALKQLDFNFCNVKIVSYLKKFKEDIRALQAKWGQKVQVSDEVEIPEEEASLILGPLEEILAEKVPEEFRQEVEEFLLYGLLVSHQKGHLEKFLKARFFPEG